jgi:hypothetical protein
MLQRNLIIFLKSRSANRACKRLNETDNHLKITIVRVLHSCKELTGQFSRSFLSYSGNIHQEFEWTNQQFAQKTWIKNN